MKLCSHCGQQLEDNARFCTRCGTAVPTDMNEPAAPTYTAPVEPVAPVNEEAYTASTEPVTPNPAQPNAAPNYTQPNPTQNAAPNYTQPGAEQNYYAQPNAGPNYAQPNPAPQAPYQGTYYADTANNPYMNNQAPFAANQPVHDNNLFEAYKAAFKNYANFEGRTRRRDYWLFYLANVLITLIPTILMSISMAMMTVSAATNDEFPISAIFVVIFSLLIGAYSIATLVPSIAILVRRLHDSGKSGWFALLNLIPYVGGLICLVFCCMDSQVGPNQYGPNPKGINGQF